MVELTLLTTIVSGINIVLILLMLYVYITNILKVKTGFTFGLALFAALFLVQNVFVFYFNITMMPLVTASLKTHLFVFTMLQTIAFAVLNWVTWH